MAKIFAHRGFRARFPENTMLAFIKAYEAKADGIELDVQMTADGEIVICHDETINRTSDGQGFIRDLTLTELQGYNFAKLYEGLHEEIPKLSSYLDWVQDLPLVTNIELKNSIIDYPGMEQKIYEFVKKRDLGDKVIYSSFNHESMVIMKQIDQTNKCGLLTESRLIEPHRYCSGHQMDCYHPEFHLINEGIVTNCHQLGIEVNPYTVNEPADIKAMLMMGVDIVITDDPVVARKCCDESN